MESNAHPVLIVGRVSAPAAPTVPDADAGSSAEWSERQSKPGR